MPHENQKKVETQTETETIDVAGMPFLLVHSDGSIAEHDVTWEDFLSRVGGDPTPDPALHNSQSTTADLEDDLDNEIEGEQNRKRKCHVPAQRTIDEVLRPRRKQLKAKAKKAMPKPKAIIGNTANSASSSEPISSSMAEIAGSPLPYHVSGDHDSQTVIDAYFG